LGVAHDCAGGANEGAVGALQIEQAPAPAILVVLADDFRVAVGFHGVMGDADVAVAAAQNDLVGAKADPLAVVGTIVADAQQGDRWAGARTPTDKGGRLNAGNRENPRENRHLRTKADRGGNSSNVFWFSLSRFVHLLQSRCKRFNKPPALGVDAGHARHAASLALYRVRRDRGGPRTTERLAAAPRGAMTGNWNVANV
jgi:hypothetical protein